MLQAKNSYFIVTIDTEEDQWIEYSRSDYSLENIKQIPELQSLFESYGIRPTYLIDYPVASTKDSAKILKKILDRNQCEIGSHCHPWNTPPFTEDINSQNSMLSNLSKNLQYEKLKNLTEIIQNRFEIRPRSFRAGRWGYDKIVAENLNELEYKIDTSLTPFMNWNIYNGPNDEGSPLQPFFFDPQNIMKPIEKGKLFEIPVTIGFNRHNFQISHKITKWFSVNPLLKKYLLGASSRLHILRKIWLSPELSDDSDMVKLIQIYSSQDYNCFNLMFHSNSLLPGASPFVKNNEEKTMFLEILAKVFKFVNTKNIQPVTTSEFLKAYIENDRN